MSHKRKSIKKYIPKEMFKTELCRSMLSIGYCDFGDACIFAHNMHELKPRMFDVKYKTQLCSNYHDELYCRFGDRCKFIHEEIRIRVGEREFWMISPVDNVIRVESVPLDNEERLLLLTELAQNPPPSRSYKEQPSAEQLQFDRTIAQRLALARAAAQQYIAFKHQHALKQNEEAPWLGFDGLPVAPVNMPPMMY